MFTQILDLIVSVHNILNIKVGTLHKNSRNSSVKIAIGMFVLDVKFISKRNIQSMRKKKGIPVVMSFQPILKKNSRNFLTTQIFFRKNHLNVEDPKNIEKAIQLNKLET